ncbi:efflux transporter outer membrane subunit [Altererythrobacter lauratis]|uniref:Efflux transporter outer membrane subunit n=1 Tax=Alteraurantiacibacter lauratis TaxID=2054627 RepID=A0ABV7EHF8_9SPHN
MPLGALALLLAGCATPQATPPQSSLAVPDEWSQAQAGAATTDLTAYWVLLNDPLITDLVEQAIANNRDLAQAAARLDQSRASLVQARSALLPVLSASGRTSRDLGDNAPDQFAFGLGLDASWEADLFGQISGNIGAAEAELLAAGYSLADLQRVIAGQVALTAINARALAQQLAIARSTLAFQEDNLQIARWRNQAGLVSSLDVEQARAQRATTAATIPALESSLAATANALSTLVGEAPGRVLVQLDTANPAPVPQPAALAGFEAPAEVLRRRPDVRGAEARLAAATARIGVARAQLFPLLRLSGNIGTNALGIGNLFDVITSGVVASVSQLIFDGGRTAAQVDSARAAARGSLAAWEQAMLQALEEVESAAVDQRSASERVAINAEAVEAANNSALLARSQYEAGLTDFRNLLTAENQLLSARNQQIAAQADRASAFVRLTQALGGGWDPRSSTFTSLPAQNDRTP